MAQYRVGDLVLFSSEVFKIERAVGQILKVIRDTDRGEANDVYSIALHDVKPVRKYVMRNKNIHGLADAIPPNLPGIDGQAFKVQIPVPDIVDDLADFIEQAAQEDKKKAAEAQILEMLNRKQEEFKKAANEAILQAKKPAPKPKKGIYEQMLNGPEIRYWAVNAKDVIKDEDVPAAPIGANIPDPIPVPIPAVPAIPKLEDYRTREGVLPKHFFYKRDGSVIPVYLASEAKAELGLSAAHYCPTTDSAHLYIFKTKPGHILHPKYDAYSGEIYFQCQITGNAYYNQHQKADVYRMQDTVKDDYNQLWIAKVSYMNQNKKVPPIPKKKLRQKYKEMPKIKEKDYDANEYVA
jgi:hypothetical protein